MSVCCVLVSGVRSLVPPEGGAPVELSEANIVHIVHQILSAVQHCHQRHIVHRDLKLENVLLVNSWADGGRHVKVADFGFAKVAPNLSPSVLTRLLIYVYASWSVCACISWSSSMSMYPSSLCLCMYRMVAGCGSGAPLDLIHVLACLSMHLIYVNACRCCDRGSI